MNKYLKWSLIILISIGGIIFLAFKLSPYPSVWILRYTFNEEANRVNKELEKFVPDNIVAKNNIKYDDKDSDAFLDVYFHNDTVMRRNKLPVIVWTHGGGLISGNKNQLSNYCKILSSKGFVVISIDYTIAPEAKYPTPILQLNKALAFISSNADELNADTSSFFLAGDSGGSLISAAAANVITNPKYAEIIKVQPGLSPRQLKGLLLYCGIYEINNLNSEGSFDSFLKTVMWAYFDKRDIQNDDYAKSASVANYLSNLFPPSFISAGNKDPLLPQSKLLADKLSALNVHTETLFYPEDHNPALNHEYQFTLDAAGELALERSVKFLKSIVE